MSDKKSLSRKIIHGAGAGLVATLPMTLFMRSAWKRLPASEQYSLPPRWITRKVISPRRFRKLGKGKQTALTLLLHFLFGAAVGSLYGMVEGNIPLRGLVKGLLAGVAVWIVSYLGWLPAFGILPPATEHPWRRNLLMIAAHLIWGLTLGALARDRSSEKNYITIH